MRRGSPQRRDDTAEPDQLLLDLVNGLRELDERVAALERRFDALGASASSDDEAAAARGGGAAGSAASSAAAALAGRSGIASADSSVSSWRACPLS